MKAYFTYYKNSLAIGTIFESIEVAFECLNHRDELHMIEIDFNPEDVKTYKRTCKIEEVLQEKDKLEEE
jgi:hypothetical protein